MPKFTVDSKYLKHQDLPPGRDVVVTIKGFAKEKVGQGEQMREKWIVYFKEAKRGLVLNSTNGKLICKALDTDEMDEWKGHKIALYVKDDVEFQGDVVSAIRVRAKAPGKPVAQKNSALIASDEEWDAHLSQERDLELAAEEEAT